MKQFTILGERNSGTNYVQALISKNFTMVYDRETFGLKHFFGHQIPDEEILNKTLTVGLVRECTDWLNSMYRNPWHLERRSRKTPEDFLYGPVHSHHYIGAKEEIMQDRNISNPDEPYTSLFDLRYEKIQFLKQLELDHSNVVLCRYEYIRDNHLEFLKDLRERFDLTPSKDYPSNIFYYKDQSGVRYNKNAKKHNVYSKEYILNQKEYNAKIESSIGYS